MNLLGLLVSLLLALISITACLATYTAQSLSAVHGESATDKLALVSFRSRIRSDPSGALASWGNLSIPMCQWRGVACGLRGHRHGHVVMLELAGLNLLGTITPALGNLTYLRRLHLSQNRLHGILPPELGNLHDLETLLLDFNSIEGQIPPSLSNCSHLVDISLYGNKFQGAIPNEFTSLKNLESLNLGKNILTGGIPSGIASLVNLQVLNLELNNMTGEIPTEIGSLTNLAVISLESNQFSGTIPSSLGNLSALATLLIGDNNLEGNITPLQGLTSLRELELEQNKFEGTIPSWLGNLSSLVIVDLQVNGLVGQIPESLGNLEELTALALSGNNLSGFIPHALGNLHALTGLYLADNRLEGPLLPIMVNLSSLQILSVQNNSLTGSFPPELVSKLSKLQEFTAHHNQFHGILPSSLCNASMLQIIQIDDNFLSGKIPQCFGTHQMNMFVATLSVNQFEAINDDDWGFLVSLTNCSTLRILDISINNLQGELPNPIGNLSTRLKFLNIEYNNIAGTITEGIGNLINLNQLYMDNNILTGTIPASLGKLKDLNGLSLSNNALSGPIPVGLGNLTQLTTLDLSANSITGAIPSCISNCPLDSLDLSHNKLSGLIPKELFFISTLSEFMDLAHNSLSGTLPSEVGNLKNLDKFDFSNNKISGEIPTSIGECQILDHLNASGNLLQGAIPLSVGNLKGLSVLDFSYNNLSGTMPEILGSLTGLSSLNLSFNRFQGGVPTDGVFLNASAILVSGNDGLCGGIPQLKLPPCSSHNTKKMHQKLAMIVSVCSGIAFVTLVLALHALYQIRRKTKVNLQRPVVSEQYIRVSYAELVKATNGFAIENLIGEGSFGSVYKGTMRSRGQDVVVAVKVLNLMQRGASQSFLAECGTLRCTRHRNLVKILTVCSSIDFQGRDFKALVYEFLSNGNLDQWLHQHTTEDGEEKALDIIARLCVAIDVASSLDYLHQHKPMPIIHCDLKPSNVLLDSDMVARVGDFGLARFLHENSEKSSGWASMRGSIGYAAPEYGLGNEVSTFGDVYSYGILLLEMFTGKRPTSSEFGEAMGLRNYVEMALPDRVNLIADQQLLTETNGGKEGTSNSGSIRETRIACIASVLQVGIRCSEETPMDRPPIGDALKEMQAIRDRFHLHFSGEGSPSIPEVLEGPFMA
ncbi:hypothetical protein BS78_04G085600 [Paspalum vaginatum]|nr:hypothetical protein BS78_04G085600 [Paspalum vaginatum]